MKAITCASLAWLLSALLFPNGVLAETESAFDVRTDVGYDSNVFDLSEIVGERPGMFWNLGASFDVENTTRSGRRVEFDTAAAAQLFEADVDDGDLLRYHLRVSGDSGGNRDEHVFDWALRYRQRDSTYVSRFTGSVAEDGAGNEIPDRFDSATGDLRIAWSLPEHESGHVTLVGSLASKNYEEDYAALGLERLDYEHFAIMPEYIRRNRTGRVRIGGLVAVREYVDRRITDMNGNLLPGTDLQYRYYGTEGSFYRELTPTQAIEISGSYEIRTDNGDGYDDRTRSNFGFAWTYRPATRTRFSVELERSDRVYDRVVAGDPTINDEPPEKEGYELIVNYRRSLNGHSELFAEARWESFEDLSEQRYSYDRMVALVGIRWELGP